MKKSDASSEILNKAIKIVNIAMDKFELEKVVFNLIMILSY